ncbi:hypothetical protein AKJ16_DCAP25504 [Drosera capensis]
MLNSSRVPVELGAAGSLMPLHSVTVFALYTSLLSLYSGSWGCLSGGCTKSYLIKSSYASRVKGAGSKLHGY